MLASDSKTTSDKEDAKEIEGDVSEEEGEPHPLNGFSYITKERPRLSVKLEVTICDFRIYVWGLSMRIVLVVIFVKREDKLRIRVRLAGVRLEDN